MRWSIAVCLFSGVLTASPAQAGLKKCVDDKGMTQYYNKTPPPECQGKATVEMSNHGVVVRRTEVPTVAAVSADAENRRLADEQAVRNKKLRDTALLNTYTDEKEIDLARDRNIQPVELAISGIEPRLNVARSRLDGLRKQAGEAEKAKSPRLAAITEDVVVAEKEVVRLEKELAAKQRDRENIRNRFEEDRQRFVELRQK